MNHDKLDTIVKIAACVCGKDGVISQVEEKMMYDIVTEFFPDYSPKHFDSVLDTFFDESSQIEAYLEQVIDIEAQTFCVKLCHKSASADGLDVKENIALNKVKAVFGVAS
ncbi:hypothetical protein BAE46_13965 [Glaciecola punicea]|uniref:hypothetical protein n=1 Tax=Glaciecola punicea TaxID=56804 RepID=UPI000872E746|nr:hypothetical protein [Glaciecola punicea]OFA29683.1 hypothetical protein BAE46_13965 [Glaciecola punicea]